MSNSKTYEHLINEYLSICKLRKKLDFAGALMQFSLITVLFSWKPAQIGLYKIAAPVLLFLSIFYFFRSVSKFRSIESKKSQTIVDGFEIETQSGGSRFFHDILEKFNLKQILLTRLVVDLLAFGILGYLTYQFLIDVAPSFAVPRELLVGLFSGALGGFACKEYYKALKPLAVKKSSITTQNEGKALDTLNDSERHRAQAIEYKKLAAIFKKNNMIGIIEMFASLGPLYYISKIDAPYVKPLGCLFALVAVFLMARDYTRSKNLDGKVVRLVLKGIDLEKKKPSFDRFFHNVLGEFSVVKILVLRSICTVLCVYYLSFSMNKILVGKDAAAGEHKVLLCLIGAAFGAITCVLYYRSYKEFDELKNKNCQ
jgi:Ca2+/Na+ antiporter